MGSLDHRHIIGAIANGQCDFIEILPDHLDDFCFLDRKESAADDCLTCFGQIG